MFCDCFAFSLLLQVDRLNLVCYPYQLRTEWPRPCERTLHVFHPGRLLTSNRSEAIKDFRLEYRWAARGRFRKVKDVINRVAKPNFFS
jgi:hypothetical protein